MRPTTSTRDDLAAVSAPWPLRHFAPHLAAALLALAIPAGALPAEPLADWLDGLSRSAQARADGALDAARGARQALEARPRGEAALRASVAIALSEKGAGGEAAMHARSLLTAADRERSAAVRTALRSAAGEILLAAGDAGGAATAFRAAGEAAPSVLAAAARFRLADALHAAGEPAQALAAWRSALGGAAPGALPPASLLRFAEALRSQGDAPRAAELLRTLWAAQPDLPEAAEAERILDAWRSSGDGVPPFTGTERVGRTFRLLAGGRTPEARDELARARADAPPADLAALAGAALLLAEGKPTEAADRAGTLSAAADPGIRRGAKLVAARAAARDRRYADAISAWKEVAASGAAVPGLPSHLQASLRDDAEYFAAWLHVDAGHPRRAAEELTALARRRPGSRRADDARWFAAWSLYRAGDTVGAAEAMARIASPDAAPRVRYWRARLSPDPAAAGVLLRSVVALDPHGYYGLLACARLAEGGEPCAPSPIPAARPLPAPEDLPGAERLRAAAELAAAGFAREPLAELAPVNGGGNVGRATAPLAAELAAFLGDALLPFRLARDQVGLDRRSLRWSFPDAWPTLVEPAAGASGVDPSLLRAVMRRESGFRTGVRSPAGAVGLLQVMPSTARRAGALLGLAESPEGALDAPPVNVPLGAAYLALLLERFGDPLVAIAAYNAGPRAAARWVTDRAGMPIDAWVESIPFRETRQYVRAVVENWVGARIAAGEPPPDVRPGRPIPAPGEGISF